MNSPGPVSARRVLAPHPGNVPADNPPTVRRDTPRRLYDMLRAIEHELQSVPGHHGWLALSILDEAKDLIEEEWL